MANLYGLRLGQKGSVKERKERKKRRKLRLNKAEAPLTDEEVRRLIEFLEATM